MTKEQSIDTLSRHPQHTVFTWVALMTLVYALLVGVGVVGDGFKWASGGAEGAERIFAFAGNPVIAVILGTMATALVQSSSTVTAVIVGLVAGGVPVSVAIPMIMGANMGTTITNTFVSLGNLRDKAAFNKSFQAATVHDFFNLYSIIVFLPIELMFQPLQRSAEFISSLLISDTDASIKGANVIGMVTKPVSNQIVSLFSDMPVEYGATFTIVAGIGLIIGSVLLLSGLLKKVMIGPARNIMQKAIGRSPAAGVASGAVMTVAVQSSSTSTSLIVPLAGAGVLSLKQIYPFTIGANIGTTVTALLAATAITGVGATVAMEIAMVHLLYNVFGAIVFLMVPWLKELPIRSATWLGNRSESNRGWAFSYVVGVFFVLPSIALTAQSAIYGKAVAHQPSQQQIESIKITSDFKIE